MGKSMGSYDLYTKGTTSAQQAKFKETAKILATGKTDENGEATNLNIPLSDIAPEGKTYTGEKPINVSEQGAVSIDYDTNTLKKDNNKLAVSLKSQGGLSSDNNGIKVDVPLPSNGQNGQVLMMKNGVPTWVELKDILPPIPSDYQDTCYVLGVDDDGTVKWVEDQTGGGY